MKLKTRIADHGEVFGGEERKVNAMLNLMKRETKWINSRFLKLVCGTDSYLVKVLGQELVSGIGKQYTENG